MYHYELIYSFEPKTEQEIEQLKEIADKIDYKLLIFDDFLHLIYNKIVRQVIMYKITKNTTFLQFEAESKYINFKQFVPVRKKIETTMSNPIEPQYFEAHYKVNINSEIINFVELLDLEISKRPDKTNGVVTFREEKNLNPYSFSRRVAKINNLIETISYKIENYEEEKIIYDTNPNYKGYLFS